MIRALASATLALAAPLPVLAQAAQGQAQATGQAPAGKSQGGGLSLTKGHDSNAPVDVTSDRIEVQDQANRAVFVGRVHVIQGDMTMDAARMTVAYSRTAQPNGQAGSGDPQIERIDASGGVTVVQPNQRATGSYGIYDLNRKIVTLIGGVKLIRGGNTVNGARAVMNLDTGRATVDGSAVGGAGGVTGSSGGRVTGRFTVPQHSQTQPATTTGSTPPPAK